MSHVIPFGAKVALEEGRLDAVAKLGDFTVELDQYGEKANQ